MALSPLFQQLASIQDNFSLEPLLNPQKIANFGVDYDGDFLDSLNMMLERDANNSQSLKKFFCGHRGCGKSTLLYECAMSQEKWYFPVFFSIADLGSFSDIDYTNILFALGIAMLDRSVETGITIDPSIRDSLYSWFDNVLKVAKHEEGGEISLDLKLVKFKLSRESETRREIGKAYEKRTEELVDRLNEIATLITDATKKPVLAIVDDLDKISNPELSLSIYCNNLSSLIAPKFSIIYTIPIAAYRNLVVMGALEALVARPIILMPVLKLAPKGQRRSLPDDFTSPAIETLSKAIDRRLPDGFKQIIEPAVTRQLILASGGVFRELIRLVYGCLQIAQIQAYQNPDLVTLTIDEAIFLEAVKEIRIDLQAPLGERDYQILTQTYKDFKPNDPGDERFIQLLHRLCILEYKNDDLWYDIHPIIEDLLRRQKLIQSK